jgi:hypothetical protein
MRRLITLLLALGTTTSFAQFGVSFHQTNLPFIGLNFEFNERIRPELRIGTDNYFNDLSGEVVVTYDIVNHDDYEFYAGAGVRGGVFEGVTIPVGVNVYPLPYKNFGFHIELTPILNEDPILRGSWGIRYKFRRSE